MELNSISFETHSRINNAAAPIRGARCLTAFTGAGISVESGIAPFRCPGGLWSKYDPCMLELSYFLKHPDVSWPVLKEIFYDHFGAARPNRAPRGARRLGSPRPAENVDHPERGQPALCGGELIAKKQPASSVNCQSPPA